MNSSFISHYKTPSNGYFEPLSAQGQLIMVTSTLSDEQCSVTTHSNSIPQESEHIHTHDSATRH